MTQCPEGYELSGGVCVRVTSMGGGGGGITALTGDVTASGAGSVAATVLGVNGAPVPVSQPLLGSNAAGQLVVGSGGVVLTRIQQIVVTAPVGSVNFLNIPQNYTNLTLVWLARSTFASADRLGIIFNGSVLVCNGVQLLAQSGTIVTNVTSALAAIPVGSILSSAEPAGQAGGGVVEIMGYSQSVFWKECVSRMVYTTGAGSSAQATGGWGGEWPSTAPITSLLGGCISGGNFATGSQFTLYGW